MPITIAERHGSPRHVGGKDPRWEYLFVATGSTDEFAVRDEVLAVTAASIEGLPRQNIEVQAIADGVWDIVVPYTRRESQPPPEPAELGASEFEFDFSTESARVRQSLQTVSGHVATGLPPAVPNFDGAINVQEDTVEGVDVLVPRGAFSETHWLDPLLITDGYRRMVMGMVGTMNSAPFRGHAAHELLLVGCRGRHRDGEELAAITFSFAVSPNRTGIAVGDIAGIDKDGWDYLWVRYGRAVDGAANVVVHRPEYAYVERVYAESDFLLLGIGP